MIAKPTLMLNFCRRGSPLLNSLSPNCLRSVLHLSNMSTRDWGLFSTLRPTLSSGRSRLLRSRAPSTMGSGKIRWKMGEASSSIETGRYLKGISRQICPTVVAGRYLATEKCMRESGLMAKCRVRVYFSGRMELHIQVSGSTIYNMAMGTRNGRMERSMRVISQGERKRVMA